MKTLLLLLVAEETFLIGFLIGARHERMILNSALTRTYEEQETLGLNGHMLSLDLLNGLIRNGQRSKSSCTQGH